MSEAKHTPGPWTAVRQIGQVVGVHKFTHAVDCADDSIASLLTKADAQLIAAAPEMLLALKLAREVIDDDLENLPARHSLGRLLAQIKAAIAKAEGGAE